MKGYNKVRFFSFTSAVLALILVLSSLLFSSCKVNNNENTDENKFDELYEAISEYYDRQTDTSSDYAEAQKAEYIIVIPARCSSEIYNAANELALTISNYFGYTPNVCYDSDVSSKNSVPEIIIFNTNREGSGKYQKRLRAGEYGYDLAGGGSFVIGAQKDADCVLAVNKFISDIKDKILDLRYPSSAKTYTFECEYDIERITLNGFELCEYTIVYPHDGTLAEKELSQILKSKITEYSGYCLNVINDKQATSSTRAICVGYTSISAYGKENIASDSALILSKNGNVEIISDSNAGIHFAIEQFTDKLMSCENNRICELSFEDEMQSYEYQSKPFALLSVSEHLGGGTLDIYANTVRGINSSDISLFSSLSASVITNVKNNGVVLEHLGNNVFFNIDQADVECLSSRLTKTDDGYMVSLELKLKSNGEHFAVICAYTSDNCDSDAVMNEIATESRRYSDIPKIIIHSLSSRLAEKLISVNEGLANAPLSSDSDASVCYTENVFRIVSGGRHTIDQHSGGDIIKLEFYYT